MANHTTSNDFSTCLYTCMCSESQGLEAALSIMDALSCLDGFLYLLNSCEGKQVEWDWHWALMPTSRYPALAVDFCLLACRGLRWMDEWIFIKFRGGPFKLEVLQHPFILTLLLLSDLPLTHASNSRKRCAWQNPKNAYILQCYYPVHWLISHTLRLFYGRNWKLELFGVNKDVSSS